MSRDVLRTCEVPDDGVLVVDGVFALRAELRTYWDLSVWLSITPELSLRRGLERDAGSVGGPSPAEAPHRDRYAAADAIYSAETNPTARADVIVNNSDIDSPVLIRSKPAAGTSERRMRHVWLS